MKMINPQVDKALNIAIIGLSLSKLSDLKAHILGFMPFDYSVNWVAANQQSIDLLMIDHYFFDSPNLQKIIAQSNSKVLKLKACSESAGTLQDHTLFLPVADSNVLKQWFNQHLLGNTPLGTLPDLQVKPASKSLDIQSLAGAAAQGLQSPNTPSKALAQPAISLDVFRELVNPHHGRICIYDSQQRLAIADTRKEMVWTDLDTEKLKTDSSFNYMHAKASEGIDLHLQQPVNLRQWLWQLIWQSPSYHSLIGADDNLRLDFWPQPPASEQRRMLLKMAACFQRGANLGEVARHLDIPLIQVQGFASACLAAGLGHTISSTQIGLRPASSQPEQPTATLSGFFNKLRKRFGL